MLMVLAILVVAGCCDDVGSETQDQQADYESLLRRCYVTETLNAEADGKDPYVAADRCPTLVADFVTNATAPHYPSAPPPTMPPQG